jgi:CRP-like cAMP-binding protein
MTSTLELKGSRYENSVREALMDWGSLARYAAGERVFAEGEPAEKVCMLMSGEVAIEIGVPGREPVPIAKVGPGEIFGWASVLTPRLQGCTGRVVKPAELMWVSGEKMRDLAAEDSHFGFELYRFVAELIAKRLDAVRTEMVELIADALV